MLTQLLYVQQLRNGGAMVFHLGFSRQLLDHLGRQSFELVHRLLGLLQVVNDVTVAGGGGRLLVLLTQEVLVPEHAAGVPSLLWRVACVHRGSGVPVSAHARPFLHV